MRTPPKPPARRRQYGKGTKARAKSATGSMAQNSAAPDGPAGPNEDSGSALIDIEAADERATDSIETLPELEREIGMSDWIDPQTGEPAEGQSPPHLDDD